MTLYNEVLFFELKPGVMVSVIHSVIAYTGGTSTGAAVCDGGLCPNTKFSMPEVLWYFTRACRV